MSRLHIYTVHVNPGLPHAYEAAEFVEEGFSWKAFFFAGFWALYHRLWLAMLAIFAFNILGLHLVHIHTLTLESYLVLHLGVHLLVGFHGNDWRRAKLTRKGFITSDIITGDSLLRGQQRFYERYFAAHPSAASQA